MNDYSINCFYNSLSSFEILFPKYFLYFSILFFKGKISLYPPLDLFNSHKFSSIFCFISSVLFSFLF